MIASKSDIDNQGFEASCFEQHYRFFSSRSDLRCKALDYNVLNGGVVIHHQNSGLTRSVSHGQLPSRHGNPSAQRELSITALN